VIVAALAATALLAGGVVTWRVLDQAAHSTTIPASFDGQWRGCCGPNGAPFTATLGKELQKGGLLSDGSSCFIGPLTVSDATDSRLTMHFEPGPGADVGCKPWTVVFTHLSGGDLKMWVDPEPGGLVPEFEVRMIRQG
jgi:hypothetical protein